MWVIIFTWLRLTDSSQDIRLPCRFEWLTILQRYILLYFLRSASIFDGWCCPVITKCSYVDKTVIILMHQSLFHLILSVLSTRFKPRWKLYFCALVPVFHYFFFSKYWRSLSFSALYACAFDMPSRCFCQPSKQLVNGNRVCYLLSHFASEKNHFLAFVS